MIKIYSDIPEEEVLGEFFNNFVKQLENKDTTVDVVKDRDEALKIIETAMQSYKENLFELTAK